MGRVVVGFASLGRDRGFPLLHPRHRALQRMRRAKANWGWSFRPTASAQPQPATTDARVACMLRNEGGAIINLELRSESKV